MTQLCRHCAAPLEIRFLDLGFAPPSNAYLKPEDLQKPELTFPLRLLACGECRLVQTEDFAAADALFTDDYAYFSSTSQGWLDHAARYADMVIERFGLGADSHVMEVASNDGYLLKNFVKKGIPCLGVEPTESTAAAARAQGIPVLQDFFGMDLVGSLDKADLIAGNNVYAHVPDINDFTAALKAALKPEGVVTLEFPHLMRLVELRQFDTVYHEHFSYLSLFAVNRVFAAAGLRIFDVEELPTHGGSLRIFGCIDSAEHMQCASVAALIEREHSAGMDLDDYYLSFQSKADDVKNDFLRFLLQAKAEGKSVAGYGAAAKGNTIMNYAGVRPDLVPYICDAAAAKIGKLMPGSHIPILEPAALRENRPDYLVILPWNIAAEVKVQCSDLAALGTRFVTAVPQLEVSD
ncbi:class I SAM-dependent methyltransferase [Parasedimentitalea huanghaiensis]|uniref:Methyltransferase domain-containing protein n=1 Tax=Parasedimentitalea huanghaiensis TaxID=2682100 RepID=A0A6L6WSW2_9RHOB|nr:class I SAM-dependent methyltransferase [Zongyanglinia huanghaiensis]MVO18622.1 methyltransferase domain-containing protein [Zongyanglinia huanghaiensis]